jgi:hypothetical protein
MKLPRLLLAGLLAATAVGVWAQRFRSGFGGDPYSPEFETSPTARGVPEHSLETPTWTNAPAFESDTFTFARLRYTRRNDAWWGGGYWWSDSPDSDLNLSWRLHQVTSIKVNPDGRYLHLTDKELFDYPWVYVVEPGRLHFEDAEIEPLRKYLSNGGFLMADDFWGPNQWANFEREMKRVLTNRTFVELPMDHPIFHCVFDLKGPISKLQTMNRTYSRKAQETGVTWESHEGVECKDMRLMAILDDKSRVMVVAAHNCDNGDGWEREGEDRYFFQEFAEKRAYPLGINIIFYAMTH